MATRSKHRADRKKPFKDGNKNLSPPTARHDLPSRKVIHARNSQAQKHIKGAAKPLPPESFLLT
jgi:hypothetical protein